MFLDLLVFAFGVALLVGGAWALVVGSSRLARLLGVPPVLVGLTVVAWGTSAPEFFVSLQAIIQQSPGLVLGNVIGSNLANIGLILGLAVLIMSPDIDRRLLRFDIPVLLVSTIVLMFLADDGWLSRVDGLVVLGLFLVVTFINVGTARDNHPAIGLGAGGMPADVAPALISDRGRLICLLMVVAGAGGLAIGGRYIVEAAVDIAETLHVSETLVGLTMVAVGTSLPELATTVVAAWRGESGIAVGNVVGSNLFNTLAVTGPVAVFRPVAVSGQIIHRELPVMFAVTLLMALMIVGRRKMPRFSGLLLLIVYLGIMIWWVVV